MSRRVVVIGGGPGGTESALRALRAGHAVTIVEQDRFGGTCTNRGCIPTKFLLAALGREANLGRRVDAGGWRKLQARKKALTEGLARKIGEDLRAAGAIILRGRGAIAGPGEVVVTGSDGAVTAVAADAIVLAVGGAPARIPALGMDGRRILSSDEILELQEIPESLIVIGSGFIGSEFGRLFALLGTRVTLVEALPHVLPAEDEDTAAAVAREFERQGVTIVTGAAVASAAATESGVKVVLADGRSLEASLALVSVGRALATGDLGLEQVGLAPDARGVIPVNPYLETAAPGIWAVGDITGKVMLAHLATAQGIIAAARIGGDNRSQQYRAIPYAVFVAPEVATVGYTEGSARAAGMKCAVGKAAWTGNSKARIDQEQAGFIKILADPSTGLLLGGTIVGPRASEMIHVLAVALQADLTADEFAQTVFVHPTLSESFREAAESLS